jgi:hypothetical protein
VLVGPALLELHVTPHVLRALSHHY